MRGARPRGTGLVEVLISLVLIAFLVVSIFEVVVHAIRLNDQDYQYTMAHSLCQEVLERAVYLDNPSDFGQIQSAMQTISPQCPADGHHAAGNQYVGIGDNHGTQDYWMYEVDVTPVNPGFTDAVKVTVSIYQADLSTGNPPTTPRTNVKPHMLEAMSTVLTQ